MLWITIVSGLFSNAPVEPGVRSCSSYCKLQNFGMTRCSSELKLPHHDHTSGSKLGTNQLSEPKQVMSSSHLIHFALSLPLSIAVARPQFLVREVSSAAADQHHKQGVVRRVGRWEKGGGVVNRN